MKTRMCTQAFLTVAFAAGSALAAPNALPDLKDIRLDGYVGNRLRSCIENHGKSQGICR